MPLSSSTRSSASVVGAAAKAAARRSYSDFDKYPLAGSAQNVSCLGENLIDLTAFLPRHSFTKVHRVVRSAGRIAGWQVCCAHEWLFFHSDKAIHKQRPVWSFHAICSVVVHKFLQSKEVMKLKQGLLTLSPPRSHINCGSRTACCLTRRVATVT